MVSDDWHKQKVSQLFSKTPEGWVEILDDFSAVVTKAVSQFEADPDVRAQSLITWAEAEVGRAVACIANFEAAPVENIPAEAEG
jgi:hypothetical protein